MKIIHCADLHLDSKMESNLDKDQAIIRRGELLATYERMVDYAVKNDVSAILIAGDLFDKPHIRKEAKKRVYAQIVEHPQIEFYYLRGNHDKSDFLDGVEELPANLHQFTNTGFTSYELEDVVISGMELDATNSSTIAQRLVLDSGKLNIVMLHGQQMEYDGRDGAEYVNTSLLKGKFIDYLALGHVHKYIAGAIDDRGVYCYPGCLEGRGFDETGDKGFVLLETDGDKISSEFIPFATRRLHEIEVETRPDMDMQSIIAAANDRLADVDAEDLVKFVVTGLRQLEDELDMDRFLRSFEGRYYFVKGYDRTRPYVDYESFKYDKSLKGEFVRLVQSQDIDEETKAKIIEIGIRAIMGEDI